MLASVLRTDIDVILGLSRHKGDGDFAGRLPTGDDQEMPNDGGGGVAMVNSPENKEWSSAFGRTISPTKDSRSHDDHRRFGQLDEK